MKLLETIGSIIAVGFWGWLSLAIFGITSTASLIYFPFGLFPIFLAIGLFFFLSVDTKLQKSIGSKTRKGTTEYPLEVSMCLYGENHDKIAFSDDGKSVILTVESPGWVNIDKPTEAKAFLREKIQYHDDVNLKWFDHYTISHINKNTEAGTHQIALSIPDEIVLSEEYIEHEINNVGRVFKRNDVGNSTRWLLNYYSDRKTIRKDGRLLVYIDRLQIVPGLFGEKNIIMSKNQITRNIKNRLWNRVNVRCINIDEKTYCGEIIGV